MWPRVNEAEGARRPEANSLRRASFPASWGAARARAREQLAACIDWPINSACHGHQTPSGRRRGPSVAAAGSARIRQSGALIGRRTRQPCFRARQERPRKAARCCRLLANAQLQHRAGRATGGPRGCGAICGHRATRGHKAKVNASGCLIGLTQLPRA